jgi:phosphoglycerate kinase
MDKQFLDTIKYSISGKNALLRTDYNVPLTDGKILNDERIKSSFPTIDLLWEKGVNNIIIITHLGRPKGKRIPELTLEPIKKYLQYHYQNYKIYLTDLYQSQTVISKTENSIILIENIRFYPEEERKSSQINIEKFEKKLANLADIFVNDAFGTCHRNHCSMMGKGYSHKVGGLLIKRELVNILPKVENPKRPFVCLIGGVKVSDKIKLIYNLLDKIDHLIIGGGMVFTFLKVLKKYPIGDSIYDKEGAKEINSIMTKAEEKGVEIHLPVDFMAGSNFSENCHKMYIGRDEIIPEGYMGMDIGIRSCILFDKVLKKAKTILWNGPMGVFEFESFSQGSRLITSKIQTIAEKLQASAIIGGGETATCFKMFSTSKLGVHISTGGGTTLSLLEGSILPGIESLDSL